jgi:ketosteroid isomerase-like protein
MSRPEETVAATDELDIAIERCHLALGDFIRGNPEPYKAMISHRDDVCLGNPFGPFACGWKQVEETMERAASLYRDGEIIGFESLAKCVTPNLAYIAEVERFRARVGGAKGGTSVALRVTAILRPEEGSWKVVHRHADPITTARPAESVIGK